MTLAITITRPGQDPVHMLLGEAEAQRFAQYPYRYQEVCAMLRTVHDENEELREYLRVRDAIAATRERQFTACREALSMALDACRAIIDEHEGRENHTPMEPCGECNHSTKLHKRICGYHAAKAAVAKAGGGQ